MKRGCVLNQEKAENYNWEDPNPSQSIQNISEGLREGLFCI